VGRDKTYNTEQGTGYSDVQIANDLWQEGLGYESAWMTSDVTEGVGSTHLIVWSSEY
jgi:hypothetical protein